MLEKNFSAALSTAALVLTACGSSGHGAGAIGDAPARDSGAMTVQLVRSATVLVRYQDEGGDDVRLLVDPLLGDEGTEPPIDYSNGIKIPMIPLPMERRQLLAGVDAVLLTHDHPDHFDVEAEKVLPKDMLLFCQPYDEARLRGIGFSNLRVVRDELRWRGLTISRFPADHYRGATGAPPFGESSSYLLRTKRGELFFTGDAVLDDRLKHSLTETHPTAIVANAGPCQFTKENPVLAPGTTITLTPAELKEMSQMLPGSKIVAVHMDAINACPLTKYELRRYVQAQGLQGKVLVPSEGEVVLR